MPNSNHLRFFQLSCRMIFFLRWCCVNHINHVVICTWTSATWYTGIYILWSAVLLTSHSETPKNQRTPWFRWKITMSIVVPIPLGLSRWPEKTTAAAMPRTKRSIGRLPSAPLAPSADPWSEHPLTILVLQNWLKEESAGHPFFRCS